MPADIKWLGHAGFRLSDGDITVYIDPYEIKEADEADIVLITHGHYDHCSPDDVNKVAGPNTVIVATPDCEDKLAGLGGEFRSVTPGQELEAAGITIRTIHAYNPDKQFHPEASQWVGYIVSIGGEKVYHTGDSDLIPEMKGLEVDVALLPVGGTYTMDAEEAAEAFKLMNAVRAIPMHYGSIVGESADAERFLKLISQE